MHLRLSPTKIAALLAIILALTGALLLYNNSDNNSASNRSLVQYATTTTEANPESQGPIVPHVVTTATKLGQGIEATPDSPTSARFEHPTLSSSSAGTALVVPGSSTLPALSWLDKVNALPPLTSGEQPRLKYDLYSWSLGTLRATTPQWIDLADADAIDAIPPLLWDHAQTLANSERVLLVIPPVSNTAVAGHHTPLNPHDAYILIADVLVPGR